MKKCVALLLFCLFSMTGFANEQMEEIQEYIKILKENPFYSYQRESASDELIKIGEKAVPSLIELLHEEDVSIRVNAAQALGFMRTKDLNMIAPLIQSAKDVIPYSESQHEFQDPVLYDLFIWNIEKILKKIGGPSLLPLENVLKEELHQDARDYFERIKGKIEKSISDSLNDNGSCKHSKIILYMSAKVLPEHKPTYIFHKYVATCPICKDSWEKDNLEVGVNYSPGENYQDETLLPNPNNKDKHPLVYSRKKSELSSDQFKKWSYISVVQPNTLDLHEEHYKLKEKK